MVAVLKVVLETPLGVAAGNLLADLMVGILQVQVDTRPAAVGSHPVEVDNHLVPAADSHRLVVVDSHLPADSHQLEAVADILPVNSTITVSVYLLSTIHPTAVA